MRFAVQTWGTDLEAVKAYAGEAEALGYDALWYGDGLWPWTHEGWTVLAALATVTTRIRLGPAVTYLIERAYRHPSLLAQLTSTVDRLSGGRLDLRVGLGANSPDAAATWRSHDIGYPDASERLARLREGLQVIKALWSGKPVEFSGKFYTLRGAQLASIPVQQPHPPIWIAAMGDRMLALAAELAAVWEASYLAPDAFARKLKRLAEHCRANGRDVRDMQRSVEVDVVIAETPADLEAGARQFLRARSLPDGHPLLETALVGDPAQCRDRIMEYREAGVTDFTLSFADFPAPAMLRLFAERVRSRLPR
jgi:alkanesulfonate monooxygenase SsuD/methylene tetrahydromethanopterin reductase-like flavin-dependent oxidoreductase (luciferase family)